MYGRLLTRFMAKYMPGTTFVVRNIPGAGNIIGVNTIYRARPDGLTFGIFNTGLIYSQMLKMEGVQFDLAKMSWIGKMADEGRTLVLATNSGLDSIDDLISAKEPIFLASSGIGAASDIEMRMLQKMLRLNVRLITNIVGGETQLSMLRGEVSGVLEAASSQAEFVKPGQREIRALDHRRAIRAARRSDGAGFRDQSRSTCGSSRWSRTSPSWAGRQRVPPAFRAGRLAVLARRVHEGGQRSRAQGAGGAHQHPHSAGARAMKRRGCSRRS